MLTIEDDLPWKMTLRVQLYPTMVYKGVSTQRWKSAKDVKVENVMKTGDSLKLVF
jgi:hypothetical protein